MARRLNASLAPSPTRLDASLAPSPTKLDAQRAAQDGRHVIHRYTTPEGPGACVHRVRGIPVAIGTDQVDGGTDVLAAIGQVAAWDRVFRIDFELASGTADTLTINAGDGAISVYRAASFGAYSIPGPVASLRAYSANNIFAAIVWVREEA